MKWFVRATLLMALGLAFWQEPANAQACESRDSGRKFEDTDCDGVKDGGEEYYGLAAGGVAADSIGTSELDEDGDSASTGQIVAVNSATSNTIEYLARADEIVSDGDTLSIDHDLTTNFAANEHVDHTSVTLTAGAGLSGGGDISSNRTFATASSEENFLISGALTCGASTAGKMQTHTTALQYCDNTATPVLRYSAYAASDGGATLMDQGITQDGGNFSTANDAARIHYTLRRQTANGTPAEVFLDGSSTRMTIPTDTSWTYSCHLVGRRTDADNETASYRATGAIDNNAGTTALAGDVWVDILNEDTTAWSVAWTADNTNDALIATVTGETAKTINWVMGCDLVQSTG